MTGALVLVAGPSGAGKDTLLRLARESLAGDPRFVFARRVITRPADAGGEDHEAVSPAEFERLSGRGAFALSWDAHGLRYGVPRAIEADLRAARTVVVNVSRDIIAEAARRYPNTHAVIVTAPVEMLAARLATRGREPPSARGERLRRPDIAPPPGMPLASIRNDRSPEVGARELVAILRRCASPACKLSPAAAPTEPAPIVELSL